MPLVAVEEVQRCQVVEAADAAIGSGSGLIFNIPLRTVVFELHGLVNSSTLQPLKCPIICNFWKVK